MKFASRALIASLALAAAPLFADDKVTSLVHDSHHDAARDRRAHER